MSPPPADPVNASENAFLQPWRLRRTPLRVAWNGAPTAPAILLKTIRPSVDRAIGA